MISLNEMSRTGKSNGAEGRLVAAQGIMGGSLVNTGSLLREMKMFWNYREVMVVQH